MCGVSQVIELVLRAEEGLLPAVVKHLTHIEEQVLESLAWRRDSPLWDQIRAAKGQGQLPAYHQVSGQWFKFTYL